jgi:hypothetical protein
MFVQDRSASPKEELERELCEQVAHVDAALCRLIELEAECERRLDWSGDRTTFAGWLAWRCSLPPRVAREHERIGNRLAEQPLTRGAFSRGELSYGTMSVLVGVAEPATEEGLLELAEALTVSQLARCLGAYRRVSAAEAGEKQEREFLGRFWSDEGWLSLRGRLAAEEGAVFLRALEAARDVLWEQHRAEQPDGATAEPHGPFSDSVRVSSTETLVALAELALARPDGDRSGGERYQVVVHVDAETLASDAEGRCELAEGQPPATETARRIAFDASVVERREQEDGSVLSLGRKRRTVSPALPRAPPRAIAAARFPGLRPHAVVDAHHIRHWSSSGETNLDNLVLLCRSHHRLCTSTPTRSREPPTAARRFATSTGSRSRTCRRVRPRRAASGYAISTVDRDSRSTTTRAATARATGWTSGSPSTPSSSSPAERSDVLVQRHDLGVELDRRSPLLVRPPGGGLHTAERRVHLGAGGL